MAELEVLYARSLTALYSSLLVHFWTLVVARFGIDTFFATNASEVDDKRRELTDRRTDRSVVI